MTKKKNTKKKHGLGRGLDALIPDSEAVSDSGYEEDEDFINCPVDKLKKNPFQPRVKFSEEEIDELASSLKTYGVLQPVLVRNSPEDKDMYQIIAGERRVRAAKKAGIEEIPVLIRDINDEQMLQISIVENIQRENLNPVEESKAYKKLMDDFGYTQEDLSQTVGKSRSAVANKLRLLTLPENITDALADKMISGGHARALLGAKDELIQNKVFYEILDKRISVRETENLIKRLNEGDIKLKTKPDIPPEFKNMAATLSGAIGTKVKILNKKNNTGKIEINFRNKEELERIFADLKKTYNESDE
ncbi:MAG: ParB/RepB/Spo0J family partition protein [Thermodesulfobacteriota bacterium]